MKYGHGLALVVVGAFWATSTLVMARPALERGGQDAAAPAASPTAGVDMDDPSAPLFVQTCIKCHDAARILATRRTRPEWQDIIQKMIEKGATGTGREFETVFDYLSRHYGKVFINDAEPIEIAKVLGFSADDAAAIVSYRETHGAFADLDAVKKVPGIDVKKLDGRDAVVAF